MLVAGMVKGSKARVVKVKKTKEDKKSKEKKNLYVHMKEYFCKYVTFIERFVHFKFHFKLMSHEPMSLFSSDSWHA